MSSDVESFKQISDSLNLGAATVGVARGASEQIVKTLQEIKNLVVTAQGENVDRAKIQTDIDAKTALIQGFVDAAQFNGLNLIDGTATADVEVLSSLNRDSSGAVTAANITVERQDLATTAGGGLAALTAVDVSTSSVTAAAGLVSIETLLQTAIDAAAAFGSSQASIKSQADFVTTLTDSLKAGVGSLTDSDIEAASAKLQALQVQQQLGVQALSIANQQPQALLSLFR
jgi:flagellin